MKISVWQILLALCIFAVTAFVVIVFSPFGKTSGFTQKTPASIKAPDTLSVGFYNVENLFDLNYSGTEYPEYRPGALGWNQQTFDLKIANISAAVIALQADILGLCEIENRNALLALRSALKKQGLVYPYWAIADTPARGSTSTCLLSKYPLEGTGTLSVDGLGRSGRNMLASRVLLGDSLSLRVFVAHWPSKMHPESGRLKLAKALAARLQTLPPRTDYCVIGDLNTDYDEWSKVNSSGLNDTRGEVGLNHVLGTVRGGPGTFEAYVDKADLCAQAAAARPAPIHYLCWLDVIESGRFTRKYRTVSETPDHMLLPPALFDRNGYSYLDRSFAPFTWNGTLLKDGAPYRWQMKGFGKRRFHAGAGYSDHLPIIMRLVKRPWNCDSGSAPGSYAPQAKNRGFELSTEGWMGCSKEITVQRDTGAPHAGRYCLTLSGTTGKNNICAGRTVLCFDNEEKQRHARISFSIQGEGKLSVRARAMPAEATSPKAADSTGARPLKIKWRYYKGESFEPAGASRFLPVCFTSWKKVALAYESDAPFHGVELEIRAGKESAFHFRLDNVSLE